MPFTPFHLGPGLGLGLALRKYLHAPTFILANVIVDIEPFLALLFGLNYPLHGHLHTFLLASFIGLSFSYVMYFLERFLHPIYKIFLLETSSSRSLKSFVVVGVLGCWLHVILDAPLYGDIKPLYPITANPFYNPELTPTIYSLCVCLGAFGMIYYLGLVGVAAYKTVKKRVRQSK
ncbi:MAG: hydrolase [Candidatus Bathyarchaeia archaeon]